MRWLLPLAFAGCAEPTGLGEASTNAYDTAASATVTVGNVFIPDNGAGGTFRVWSIEIGEAPPGTDCQNRGDALIVFEVYTTLSSAPRGVIRLETEPPPLVFPAVYAHYANGIAIDGTMSIDAASSSGLYGTFEGQANLGGTVITLDAAFDAPTCGL